jgi:hypothetical protein
MTTVKLISFNLDGCQLSYDPLPLNPTGRVPRIFLSSSAVRHPYTHRYAREHGCLRMRTQACLHEE